LKGEIQRTRRRRKEGKVTEQEGEDKELDAKSLSNAP
jgi:hypothetical protein